MERVVTEDLVLEALARRYAAPEYAFIPHVANATGAGFDRTADAIAMCLYPSRGLTLHGFEIKVARSDWQRELKDPSKAEAVAQHCDYWWIVAPEGVVENWELPLTWGYLPYRNGNIARPIPARRPLEPPKNVSRKFLAAILRADSKDWTLNLKSEYDRGRNDGFRESEASWKRSRVDLAAKIKEFEDASGIDLSREWRLGRIGEIVRAIVSNGGTQEHVVQIQRTRDGLARTVGALDAVLGRLKEAVEG